MLCSSRRALAALALLLSASAAHAGTFNYSGYGVYDNQNVFIDLKPTPAHPAVHEWAGSGEIVLYSSAAKGGALGTWCIDIPDTLRSAGTFKSGSFLATPLGGTINALLTHTAPLLGQPDVSSATQLAIWTAEYGDDVRLTSSDHVMLLANQFLGNVKSGAWRPDSHSAVTILTADGANQDQAYLTAVPEPSTVAALSAGLLGLSLIRRRKG